MAEKKLLQLLDSINIDKNTNLLPTTLKDGVTCLGVEGDVAPLSITEDATAAANDMAAGVTAYINNEKVTGTLEDVDINKGYDSVGYNGDCFVREYADDPTKLEIEGENTWQDFIFRKNAVGLVYVQKSRVADVEKLTPEKLLEGNTVLGVEGTAKSLDITNDATATADVIQIGQTAYVNGEKIEGTVPFTSSTGSRYYTNVDITEGTKYGNTGLHFEYTMDQRMLFYKGCKIDLCPSKEEVATAINLTPEKIIEGNTVLGVVGTGTTGVDTSDATATAEFIANGKTAYVNDEKVTGTADHYVTSDDTIILASAAVTENVMGLDCVTYTTPIQNGLCSTPTMFISGEKDFRLALPVDRIASAIELTADKVVKGNTVLGIEGTAELEEGTKIYASLTDLQAVTGTEGQFAIVYDGTTFDGVYQYTSGAWVEMFSSRRYEGTLTPEEYEQAVATATDIQGGGNA